MNDFARIEAELLSRGYTRMVFDIVRVASLLDLLGSPQRAYPAIHLTGTNGKTSTARMIDALLRAHGLRTGRYTSPHLDSVRERISIEAEPISEERFVEVYREVAPVARFLDEKALEIGTDTLTYFDMTTAMAFAAFADAPVDVAVVEVGLGGAEDSTNVLQAQTCVITPIGLDHMEWLGDTIADIAWAKAGIVHKGATLVCAAQPEEAVEPILRRCTARTRRRTRWWRSRRRRPSSGPASSVRSTLRWCGPGSRRPARRGGWSVCVAPRRSCSTPLTTPPGWRPPWRRCKRSSTSAAWSPSWACLRTRMRTGSWRRWNRLPTPLWLPAAPRPAPCPPLRWLTSPWPSSVPTGYG